MFTDEVEIVVRSGKGGSGAVSFRREKYVPHGGPDGGNGGKGGDVVFKVKKELRTLYKYKGQKFFKAKNGNQGEGQQKDGKSGENLVMEVPPGTIIRDAETDEIIADLDEKSSEYCVAVGGKGGKGNAYFKSSTNQTPRHAQTGMDGTERHLKLELKLIADVGLVGLPNAGKSTLLSRLSRANPKIAAYPFTTLQPNLGVVYLDYDKSFIVADIPGLIEGAHSGTGLGIRFLKHIERTKCLLFMIDIFEEEPFNSYQILKNELLQYSEKLLEKPYFISLNKIDLLSKEEINEKKDIFQKKLKESSEETKIFLISGATNKNINELKKELYYFLFS